MRLLCVEDEAPLREDIVEFLRMKSYEVDEAATGEDAIDRLNSNHYDLVLCDIKMPRMDGYELLRQVRGENMMATTPFIFLSALNERDDRIRAHEGGCDGYLTKPIDFSLLDTTLKSHIERQRARDFLYTNAIESMRQQVMAVLDDVLNGSVTQATLIADHLQTTLPVLTPTALAEEMGQLQQAIGGHTLQLNLLHASLALGCRKSGVLTEYTPVDALVRMAAQDCAYHYPERREDCDASGDLPADPVLVDTRHFRQALAGLMANLPVGASVQPAVRYAMGQGYWTLTVADHAAMHEDIDFAVVDEATDLSKLAPVTRRRLVALMYAMQVAHAHGGRVELCLWPEDHLAVRFVIPQANATMGSA